MRLITSIRKPAARVCDRIVTSGPSRFQSARVGCGSRKIVAGPERKLVFDDDRAVLWEEAMARRTREL